MAKEKLTSADQYNWADWHTSRIKGMFEALRCQGAITPEMTDELFRTFTANKYMSYNRYIPICRVDLAVFSCVME